MLRRIVVTMAVQSSPRSSFVVSPVFDCGAAVRRLAILNTTRRCCRRDLQMKHILTGCLALFLGLAPIAAQSDDKKPGTLADQYRAILKEYQVGASGGDGTDEGRKKAIDRLDKLRPGIAQKFLDLAEKNPADPIAVDSLIQAIWMVNHNSFPAGGKDNPGNKAMVLLVRNHVESDKLGPICLRITTSFRAEHETFLRTVLAKNPHKSTQGLACLALGQFLNNRMQRLDQIKEQPELAREYERRFGAEVLNELRRQDRAAVAKEIEALFERAAADYADEKIPYDGT